MDETPTTRSMSATGETTIESATVVEPFAVVNAAELATVEPALAERFRSLGVATLNLRARATLGRAAYGATEPGVGKVAEGIVAIGDVIAKGGMGEIRSGVQHRLRREVAVKRPLPDAPEGTHDAMLREAWIAGALEHPNILPIHTLSRDAEAPLIVMKRVYGRVWAESLHAPDRPSGDARWLPAIAVLVEVCRAVHFAHSRGVLHLDLKPDNVMVGEHGEVLLLDWGLAASFDARLAPDFVPRAASIDRVCGTIGYLSPEQARASGAEFGPATDVYLLGAVLHEILTGRPPHWGNPEPTFMMSLVSSYRAAPPAYPPSVPEELAAIATRALARAPSDRFPDVDAFRRALEAFLAHRPALALTAKADALRTEIAYDRGSMTGRSSMQWMTEEVSTEAQVDACRFAYQQALRSYPGCTAARDGLAALSELRMARAESMLDVAAGRSALDDHPSPKPEFVARVDALTKAAAADAERVQQLRALSADEDVDRDRAVRIRLALTGGTSWSAWNIVTGWLDRSGIFPVTTAVLLTHLAVAFAVFLVVLASVGRRALTSTAVNRRALTIVFAAFAETWILWLGAAQLGIDPHRSAVLAFAGYLLAGLAVTAVLDPRTWWGTLAMVVPALAAAEQPDRVFYYTACLGPIGGAGLAYLWWRRSPPETEATA